MKTSATYFFVSKKGQFTSTFVSVLALRSPESLREETYSKTVRRSRNTVIPSRNSIVGTCQTYTFSCVGLRLPFLSLLPNTFRISLQTSFRPEDRKSVIDCYVALEMGAMINFRPQYQAALVVQALAPTSHQDNAPAKSEAMSTVCLEVRKQVTFWTKYTSRNPVIPPN